MATQIERISKRAVERGWWHDSTAGDTDGHIVYRLGQVRVSITYGPSTGIVQDAFAQVLDDNGDAVSRETIVRANDTDKTRKILDYITV